MKITPNYKECSEKQISVKVFGWSDEDIKKARVGIGEHWIEIDIVDIKQVETITFNELDTGKLHRIVGEILNGTEWVRVAEVKLITRPQKYIGVVKKKPKVLTVTVDSIEVV